MNQAERDRARIAELRRLARVAQGREPEAAGPPATRRAEGHCGRWEPETGSPRFVRVGPGIPVLLPEEVARRLGWSLRDVAAKVAAGEVESLRVGWSAMIPLAEVERIERSVTPSS